MPSPFPGMNPYFEQPDVWHDFHESFMPAIRDQLTRQLASHYVVKIDEHVYIQDPQEGESKLVGRADVLVAARVVPPVNGVQAAVAEAPSQVIVPTVDMERLSYLKIHDRRDRQLVAVIELLSPANKNPGPNRGQYVSKRAELLGSSAHFVEIDLLRGGPRMPFSSVLPACAYYAMVSRMEERPRAGFWPISLRESLPRIPIPVRAPDADAQVDLQQLVHQIYDAARYGNYIYEGAPEPALDAADAAWAQQFLPK